MVTRNIKMVTRHGPCQRHRAPIGTAGMTAKALKRRRVQAPEAWQALTQAGQECGATSSEEEKLDEYGLYQSNCTANNSCRLPGPDRKMATYAHF